MSCRRSTSCKASPSRRMMQELIEIIDLEHRRGRRQRAAASRGQIEAGVKRPTSACNALPEKVFEAKLAHIASWPMKHRHHRSRLPCAESRQAAAARHEGRVQHRREPA
jgi:hypothetical protein